LAELRNFSLSEADIILHEKLSYEAYRIRIALQKDIISLFHPGMFAMLKLSDSSDPLLNRPFSISFISFDEGWVDILYRVVGKGTKLLTRMERGEKLKILAPLGRGFPNSFKRERPLVLIGGGLGIATLLSLFSKDFRPIYALLWGFREHSSYINLRRLYPIPDETRIILSSEDGSFGKKGTILEVFETLLERGELPSRFVVFACGPLKMLSSLHDFCRLSGNPLFVSMETHMACGMGYCLGCALPRTGGGYLKTCREGPVFNSTVINWDRIDG